jgi:hypothetical protein
MNIATLKPIAGGAAALLLGFALSARAAETDHHGFDAGGGGHASASYRNHGSMGGLGGLGAGDGSGVVNRAGFAAQLNETPDLPVRVLERGPGQSLKIDPAWLSQGLIDPEGDSFVVESVAASSAAGMALTRAGQWLVYEAAPAAPATDTFTYRVTDGIGDRVEGVVTILESSGFGVGPSLTRLRIEPVSPGLSYRVSFVGIPGRTYRVETTTNLVEGPWTTLDFGLAGPDGLYAVTNTPSANEDARFYRSFRQP